MIHDAPRQQDRAALHLAVLAPAVTSALNTALTDFNEETTGPGHRTD
jgi:hypothetical protein